MSICSIDALIKSVGVAVDGGEGWGNGKNGKDWDQSEFHRKDWLMRY